MTSPIEQVDALVVGTGPGGSIPAYYLAAGGAKVVMLERGPWLRTEEFTQSLQIGTYTRIVDLIEGQGVSVVAGNCVGGSSVVYYAAALRAPSFVFERRGLSGVRQWPKALTRSSLDPWYDRVEHSLPVAQQTWDDVPYAGGLWAAACNHAGWTCNPVPVAVDLARCVNCNWMLNGCRFDAKRSMLLNYIPGALAHGAEIRPLHEVQSVSPATTPGYTYRVTYTTVDSADYRVPTGAGAIECRLLVLAAGTMGTPVILQRSQPLLPKLPAAVGRYFSPNGDHVTMSVFDDQRIQDVLGLQRTAGVGYEAFPIGKPISSMTYDALDGRRPEFERYSLQQIYFPPIVNILPGHASGEAQHGGPAWFGTDKRALTAQWRSWLNVLAMTEDGNEGVFGAPPPTGNFIRAASSASVSTLTYQPSAQTLRGWSLADSAIKSIVEKDGLGAFVPWDGNPSTLTAHPLSSCRMGDDPASSALDDLNELRGYPGLFVTDGSAVPTSLCVNPSLTIAALAERAVPRILDRARQLGVPAGHLAPPPGG